MDKYYFSYREIHKTIQDKAKDIITSGFIPDYILAIGGGGLIPARILRTFIEKPIVVVSLYRYKKDGKTLPEPVKHQWIEDIRIDLNGKKVLLVDEVDDCRTTLEYCIRELYKSYKSMELSVFVVHNKRKEKQGVYPEKVKHVFVGEEIGDKWINYPWDSMDIDAHEQLAGIEKNKHQSS